MTSILNLKQRIFSGWHTMRWVALSIGLFFAGTAFIYSDTITGVFGAFFLFQALTNTGCMVSQTCGTPAQVNHEPKDDQEIEYSEIK